MPVIDRDEQRQEAIEFWYRIFCERNPNVCRDDVETAFDELDKIEYSPPAE
jgi:hypothetical protein